MEKMLDAVAMLSDEELAEVAAGQRCSNCSTMGQTYTPFTYDGNCNLC
ncbi:MAG: hypothetical protein ACM32O_09450 [Clostridia bacterium]